MAAQWEKIGLPRWYDCKLGRMNDKRLARLVGTTHGVIRYRRKLFGISAWSAALLIEPFRHLVGVEPDRKIAARSGVSVSSVTTYRESLGIAPATRPAPRKQRIPAHHPIKPYRQLLGLVPDTEIAALAGVSVAVVESLRESFGFGPVAPAPAPPTQDPLPNYQGPWLGYESLFGFMSAAKISRAVGVPISVVEQRQQFLGVTPYKRVSRITGYEHLLGVVSNNVLAKLVGLTPARIADIRTKQGHVMADNTPKHKE